LLAQGILFGIGFLATAHCSVPTKSLQEVPTSP
jgi:hypothetical protein